jgi:tryptophanyl-tRNA synthetase
VFAYMDSFNRDQAEVEDLKARYRAGKVGDVAVKRRLAVVLNEYLAPIRQRREQLAARPNDLIEILQAGTDHAREQAEKTLAMVQDRMGLATNLIQSSAQGAGGGLNVGEYPPEQLLYVP